MGVKFRVQGMVQDSATRFGIKSKWSPELVKYRVDHKAEWSRLTAFEVSWTTLLSKARWCACSAVWC